MCNSKFQDLSIPKVIDTSFICHNSTNSSLESIQPQYIISNSLSEIKNHNSTIISSHWKLYDETSIPPYKDGSVVSFVPDNPYGMRWLWHTEGNVYFSYGKDNKQNSSTKYQTLTSEIQNILSNTFISDCTDFNLSRYKDELCYASYWSKADIGAIACTSTGEYKICLRGPADRITDFKIWLISIIYPQSLILTNDTPLAISVLINGGFAMGTQKEKKIPKWLGKLEKLF